MSARVRSSMAMYCGREIREPGTLGREFRKAAYDRQLRWARGAGLSPRTGFRGLRREVGSNPALGELRVALEGRVAALPMVAGDPFAEEPEPVPSLRAA